ncbi:MAG: T9SS type A sorting domain-containing protein [Melioribacteraceae bacterium]|nr:T9SS type A sorting domain-containing protein [Melioribacteraceae bacterium]
MRKISILFFALLCLFASNSNAQTLLSPANGSTGVSSDLIVSWSPPATGTVVSYQVQASIADPNFWYAAVDKNVGTDLSTELTGLFIYTQYYWRVIALYDDNSESVSPVWSFTVGSGSGGGWDSDEPHLSAPVNNSTYGITTSPTLYWWYVSTGNPVYTVEVSTTSGDYSTPVVSDNTTETYYELTGLTIDQKYYWQVTADGKTSEEWCFTPTSSAGGGGGAPNLSAPVDEQTYLSLTPTLYWWYSTQVDVSYNVQVSASDDFSGALLVDETVVAKGTGSYKVLESAGLTYNTTYYWRVGLDGNYSDPWEFKTLPSTPVYPEFSMIDLEYFSDDNATKFDVPGNFISGYYMALLPLTGDYYYFDLGAGTAVNTPLVPDDYGFYLTSTPDGFLDYWDGRGVNESSVAGTWQAHMWQIINGDEPIFYIHTDGVGNFALYDGLQKDFATNNVPFIVNDDYWQGDYTVEGTIIAQNTLSSTIEFNMNFNDGKTYFTNLKLEYNTDDDSDKYDVPGDLINGYSLSLLPLTGDYYYLFYGSGSATSLPLKNNVDNPFYLTGLPSPDTEFFAYWDAKGVNASASGNWQEHMWDIITGIEPMFYLAVDGSGDIQLLDGLFLDYFTTPVPFKINDDYPLGDYQVTGTLESIYNIVSDEFTIDLNFNNTAQIITIEDITGILGGATVSVDVNLDLSGSFELDGSLQGKFEFDNDQLDFKYASYGTGTLINDANWLVHFFESDPGVVEFIATGLTPIDSDGLLFQLNFQVVDIDVSIGTLAEINANTNDWVADGTASVFTIYNGSIEYADGSGSPSDVRGDATLDYLVTMDDAIAVIYHVYQYDLLTDPNAIANAAAADGNAGVSINDAFAIMNFIISGQWSYDPLPAPPAPSMVFDDPSISDENVISLPIEVENDWIVKNTEVEFIYDPEKINYQSFAALINGSGIFTNAVEIEPGRALLTFVSQSPLEGNFKPAKVLLNIKDGIDPEDVEITTKFKLNDGEFIDGPTFSGSITDIAEESIIPEKFAVEQNYPNPFNPSTSIVYNLPEASHITIKIYDMLGSEVKTLVNSQMNAGRYEVVWNGDNNFGSKVSSGSYLLRVTAGKNVAVKKMLLLK